MTRLPGRVTVDGLRRECMETVCRSFLLAAPRIAGAVDGTADAHLEWYSRALLAGTRPDGAEAWPWGVACRTPLPGITNTIVEAANVAFGLFITRDRLWAHLSRPEQQQIAAWLRHHAGLEVWQSNWQLFPAMAEAFLHSVGEDTGGATGWRNVARVESFHLGDGWYTDGPERAIDYYNAWAIHPYLWAWYAMTGTVNSPEGQRHLGRLHDFVASYARMFAPDGSMLHFGRSLTYRTAALAALWCAELGGVNPLSPGATRRLASGVLRKFVDRGVGVDAPLSLGWYDAYEPMCQAYSGFGSPYLAGIGFLGLALPAGSAVWTAQEEQQPTDGTGFDAGLPATGWVLSAPGDGVVRLVNHGSDHAWLAVGDDPDGDDPHYAKFAYSTHTAPGTAVAWADDVDSHIALIGADGRASRRVALRGSRVEGTTAGSVHLPQLNRKLLEGCAITTVSFVHGIFEVRAHLVTTPVPHQVREGGFAVAGEVPPEASASGVSAWVSGGADGLTAACLGLHGWNDAFVVEHRDANAMGRHAATPALEGECAAGDTVLVTLHVLTVCEPPTAEQMGIWREAAQVTVAGTRVSVGWADGTVEERDVAAFVPWDHITGPKSANL